MNRIKPVAIAAVIAGAVLASASAHAQTGPQQTPPPPRYEMDPAKRVPVTPPADTYQPPLQPATQSPYAGSAQSQPYTTAGTSAVYEDGRGGFFLGVQGGKGWVYDDVDQSALMVNAGYRWQAGSVALIGVELASGRLDSTSDDGQPFGEVDYSSIGVNARFNFGRTSPVYGLVRAGYWAADEDDSGMDVDGGYFGLGVGVDVNRHFNLSLVYTNYVYADDYSYDDDDFYYDASRAETLMLGAEVRF